MTETRYKDFSQSKVIAVDCETKDPDLKTKGPAIHRGGYVLGFSLADETGFAEYYDVGHRDGLREVQEKNLDYLEEVMALNIPKLGQNILYDFDWFQNFLGIKVNGKWWDLMMAESLIDENQFRYGLDHMAEKYLQLHKKESIIDRICAAHGWKGPPQEHLWKMRYQDVREYAIGDVQLPIRIFEIQWKMMHEEKLLPLFDMEMGVYPLLIHMRKNGVGIDVPKLRQLEDRVSDLLIEGEEQLNDYVGFELNYNAATDIAQACDRLGIKYPLTPKTKKPSFQKPWMEAQEHPLFQMIVACRRYSKLIGTFLESQIKHQVIDGRIYGQFHPAKADDGGTVTGRFSASNPNLQFIPNPKSYEEEEKTLEINLGKAIRSLFVPMEGHRWGKKDYSQIEFRLAAHFAIGLRAEEIRQTYNENAQMDYHQWCAEIAAVTRHRAKRINFGLLFGMGIEKLCRELGMSVDEGEAFLTEYNQRVPFIKQTLYAVKGKAEARGWVKTILGRRRRFPDRRFSYKALNAVIQGSAADIMKKSMKDAWEAGIYADDALVPLLTVHDEMDTSIPPTKIGEEAFAELGEIMEGAVKLKVPVLVESEEGPDWGNLK